MTAPSTLMSLLPQGDLAKGGSRVGWSFIKTFKSCEMEWFNTYLRPHTGAQGGLGHTFMERPGPRSLGTTIHHMLQVWYLSDCEIDDTTGRCRKSHDPDPRSDVLYSLDAAVAACAPFVYATWPHWDSSESAKTIGDATALFERHHAYCGPGGTMPESRTWRVLHDGDNVPFVERTFEISLGYSDYIFTTKTDLVVSGYGKIWPLDHKTHDAGAVPKNLRKYKLDGQISGQVWALRNLWDVGEDGLLKPRAEWLTGEGGLVNVIIKRAAASRPPRQLEIMGRTELDLEVFRTSTVRTLKRINERVEEWQGHVTAGMDPDAAALLVFDSYPDGMKCGEWPCDYFDGCSVRDMLGEWLEVQAEPRWVPPTA